ncbi:MAG: hypothetical protein BWY92_01965 [Firmicutes bacterium ADurb.BinA052]|nr:MAG: hypothetical protein BWY92_01965 [Firmicutes bacterium ADurb.BinA052]
MLADIFIDRRRVDDALQKRADIQARSPDHQRPPALQGQTLNHRSSLFAVESRIVLFVRIHDVDQMMPDPVSFLARRFGRADVQITIDLQRIRIDNLRAQGLRQLQREAGLSRCRGRADHHQWNPGRLTFV